MRFPSRELLLNPYMAQLRGEPAGDVEIDGERLSPLVGYAVLPGEWTLVIGLGTESGGLQFAPLGLGIVL